MRRDTRHASGRCLVDRTGACLVFLASDWNILDRSLRERDYARLRDHRVGPSRGYRYMRVVSARFTPTVDAIGNRLSGTYRAMAGRDRVRNGETVQVAV